MNHAKAGTFDHCPCCGGPLPPSGATWNNDARTLVTPAGAVFFTPLEARIVDALWRARRSGRWLSREDLMDAMYADDPEGGSDCVKTVAVYIWRIRRRTGSLPVAIESQTWRTGCYRLVVAQHQAGGRAA